MNSIDITMRHGTLSPETQDVMRDRVGRLEKHLQGTPRIELVLDRENEDYRCEVIVHATSKGSRLVAHHTHNDLLVAVDQTLEKMTRQLVKFKDRRRDHRGARTSEDQDSVRQEPEEQTYEDIVDREIKGE